MEVLDHDHHRHHLLLQSDNEVSKFSLLTLVVSLGEFIQNHQLQLELMLEFIELDQE
jgi:hypothetical protein